MPAFDFRVPLWRSATTSMPLFSFALPRRSAERGGSRRLHGPSRESLSRPSRGEPRLARFVLGIQSRVNVEPGAHAPMVQSRRRCSWASRGRGRRHNIFRVRRDARHLLAHPKATRKRFANPRFAPRTGRRALPAPRTGRSQFAAPAPGPPSMRIAAADSPAARSSLLIDPPPSLLHHHPFGAIILDDHAKARE